MIKTKHAREAREPTDGTRIYISRFIQAWERRKKDGSLGDRSFDYDEIYQHLGPSKKLHSDITEHRISWPEYVARYKAEMQQPDPLERIREFAVRSADGETITLLCKHSGDVSPNDCHRFILKDLVDDLAKGR